MERLQSFGVKRMKIDKEQVDKLNQLDRIEYRLRWKNTYDFYSYESSTPYTVLYIGILGVLLFLSLLLKQGGFPITLFTFRVISFGIAVLVIFFIAETFVSIFVNGYVKRKKLCELDKEYFEVKVKPKK